MKQFLTSDLHLGHGRILDYSQRPFKDTDRMNAALIKNWNMRVLPEDTIFHVGTGMIEKTQAYRRGMSDDCEQFVSVPFKSLETAHIALALAGRNSKRNKLITLNDGD